MRYITEPLKKNYTIILILILSMILMSCIDVYKAWLMGYLLDNINDLINMKNIIISLVFIFMLMIASAMKDYSMEKLKGLMHKDILESALHRLLYCRSTEFYAYDVSWYINFLSGKVELMVDEFIGSYILTISTLLSFVIGSFYIFSIDWKSLIYLYGLSLVVLTVNSMMKQKIQKFQKNTQVSKEKWIQP